MPRQGLQKGAFSPKEITATLTGKVRQGNRSYTRGCWKPRHPSYHWVRDSDGWNGHGKSSAFGESHGETVGERSDAAGALAQGPGIICLEGIGVCTAARLQEQTAGASETTARHGVVADSCIIEKASAVWPGLAAKVGGTASTAGAVASGATHAGGGAEVSGRSSPRMRWTERAALRVPAGGRRSSIRAAASAV